MVAVTKKASASARLKRRAAAATVKVLKVSLRLYHFERQHSANGLLLVHFKSSARGNRVASCDDKVCHRDCYQHGGFTGGSCSKDGECKCEERLPPDDGGDFDRDQGELPCMSLGGAD